MITYERPFVAQLEKRLLAEQPLIQLLAGGGKQTLWGRFALAPHLAHDTGVVCQVPHFIQESHVGKPADMPLVHFTTGTEHTGIILNTFFGHGLYPSWQLWHVSGC
jgi:hypothetical protein